MCTTKYLLAGPSADNIVCRKHDINSPLRYPEFFLRGQEEDEEEVDWILLYGWWQDKISFNAITIICVDLPGAGVLSLASLFQCLCCCCCCQRMNMYAQHIMGDKFSFIFVCDTLDRRTTILMNLLCAPPSQSFIGRQRGLTELN